MIRTVLLSLALVITAISTRAETVTVRSAEHEGFTRIVVSSTSPSDIEIRSQPDAITLILPPTTSEIVTQDFFKRISKDKIASIQSDVSTRTVSMKLTCECDVNSFLAGQRMLVLDLMQVAPILIEAELPAQTWRIAQRINQTDLRFQLGESTQLAARLENTTRKPDAIKSNTPAVSSLTLPISSAENFSDVRLIESLAKSDTPDPARLSDRPATTKKQAQILFRSKPSLKENGFVDVETAASEGLGSCDLARDLNPQNWPKYENASAHLSQARIQSAQLIESASDSAKRKLALAYIGLALGAEARALLGTISSATDFDMKLMYLTSVIDEQDLSVPTGWMTGIHACAESLTWRVLNFEKGETNDTTIGMFNDKEIAIARKQFEDWPSELRNAFAVRFSNALLRLGNSDDAAFTIRKAQERSASGSGHLELAKSKQAGPKEAIGILNPLVARDDRSSPNALLELAKLAEAKNESLSDAHQDALETYQEELKGTQIEPELLRSRINSAIRGNDFEQAMLLFDQYISMVRASQANLVLDEIGTAVQSLASDADFLKEAVSMEPEKFAKLSAGVQRNISSRMKKLGFDDLAMQLGQTLSPIFTGASPDDTAGKPNEASQANTALVQIADVNVGESIAPSREDAEQSILGNVALDETRTAFRQEIDRSQMTVDRSQSLRDELRNLGL